VTDIKGNSYRPRDRVAQEIYTSAEAAKAYREGAVTTEGDTTSSTSKMSATGGPS
jgi:hypothetical protein